MNWPVEHIPDECELFRRVHGNDHSSDGKMLPKIFRQYEMSCDWSKYRTAQETQAGGEQPAKRYAVVKFPVGDVRAIPGQVVKHAPDIVTGNQAHTHVLGPKDTPEVRLRFYLLAEANVVIPLASDWKS